MKHAQSTAIESNANNIIEHIDYTQALSHSNRKQMIDAMIWDEIQEEYEMDFLRTETVNKGRAYANNHQEDAY